jgi:glycosyltransferase involved in cell wall biosynthesis
MSQTDKNTTHHSGPKQPLITIIVAVLDSAKTLNRCIRSINEQNYSYKELIVMDGGSTDNSINILRSYGSAITYWESETDKGIYHAWNKALKHATGEWICFLGADDYFWDNQVLVNMVPYIIKAKNCGIRVVYGRIARMDQAGQVIKFLGEPWEKIKWLMSHGMPLPHTGLMHHQSLFKTHGMFDETYRIAGDYEFLLRELKNSDALYVHEIIVAGWQAGGISDHKFLSSHIEMGRARRKNGFTTPSWIWLTVHIRGFLRNYWRRLKIR